MVAYREQWKPWALQTVGNDFVARNRTTGNDGTSSKRNTLQNSGIADNNDPTHRTADRIIDKTSNTSAGRGTLASSGQKTNPKKINVQGSESKPKVGQCAAKVSDEVNKH